VGVLQGFSMSQTEPVPGFGVFNPYIPLFGLLGPPILALVNRAIQYQPPKYFRALSKHVNVIFFIASSAMVSGAIGFMTGAETNILLPTFFFSAGIGFFLAHVVYPDLACRPSDGA